MTETVRCFWTSLLLLTTCVRSCCNWRHNWVATKHPKKKTDVAEPAYNRTFQWHCVLVSPSTSFASPVCPSPWRFYYKCNCCERLDCLVHVTGEFKSKDPVSNLQAQHSQTSLKSSQIGQRTPVVLLWCRANRLICQSQFSTISIVEMWTNCQWVLNLSGAGVRAPSGFSWFFFTTNRCCQCFVLVVDVGGFHDNWDLGFQEIFPSLRTLTYETERTLDLHKSLVVNVLVVSVKTHEPTSYPHDKWEEALPCRPGGSNGGFWPHDFSKKNLA